FKADKPAQTRGAAAGKQKEAGARNKCRRPAQFVVVGSVGDQRMNAALRKIPQDLLHQIRAGRKRSKFLHVGERHVVITTAFYDAHNDCGIASADRQSGKMQHSERGKVPCQVSEVSAVIIAEALSIELVARLRDGVKTLDR